MKNNHQLSAINHHSTGFSLVEVTLAVFMIGLGVLSLFGLFPAGLRQSEAAMQDTHLSLFADKVFSGIRAEASAIVDWTDWIDNFEAEAIQSVEIVAGQFLQAGSGRIDHAIQNNVHISYQLEVFDIAGAGYLRGINLRACIGDAYSTDDALWFYTEVVYNGME